MNSPDIHSEKSDLNQITSLRVLFARLTWVIAGPIVLLLVTMGIASGGEGWTTWLDLTFAAVVALMIAGRWVEHKSGEGTTFRGTAQTDDHVRRYALGLALTAAGIWVAANVLGNHILL